MKPNRPLAFAVLLLACVLLPAGFFPHDHDGEHAGGDDRHHCVVCCHPHHAAITSAAVPAASIPDVAVCAAPTPNRGHTRDTALGIRPTRGPPA